MAKSTRVDKAVPKAIRVKASKAELNEILGWEYPHKNKIEWQDYESIKLELQIELLKMQKWIKASGEKVVMLFEGRDAGGKGGTIKRFTEHMNPRWRKC